MSTAPKPSRAKHLAEAVAARPDVPHTFKLPDGRVVYAEVPGDRTTERGGETVLLPAATMAFLDRVQALAMKARRGPAAGAPGRPPRSVFHDPGAIRRFPGR